MTPLLLALILFLGGVILLIAEVLLPTHGLLGVLGLASIAGTAVSLYFVDEWLGLASLAILVLSSPFWFMLAMRIWPRTWVGRRLVLTATVSVPEDQKQQLQLGTMGIALTEMRPMGECEFGGLRVQARSQLNIIAAGTRVKIVAMDREQPVVISAPAT
jgi:membrane-bound serine protease (ClpP class)